MENKKLNNYINKNKITDEEFNLIIQYIKIRSDSNISQRNLSSQTGLAQSTIARMEKNLHSASLSTFINVLNCLGYHLEIKKNKKDIEI